MSLFITGIETVQLPFKIENVLDENERLIATTKPVDGWLFHPDDKLWIPFGLLFFLGGSIPISILLFASLFFLFSIESSIKSAFFCLVMTLIPMPHLVIGFYLSIGSRFFDRKTRKTTKYYLTNRRLVIISGKLGNEMKTYPLASVQTMTFDIDYGDVGSIAFENLRIAVGTRLNSKGRELGIIPNYFQPMVRHIPNVSETFQLIQDIKSGKL